MGKDVDAIIRDLIDVAVKQTREWDMKNAPAPKTLRKMRSWMPRCRPRALASLRLTARRARCFA